MGRLTEEEWPLLVHAFEVFSDAKIFMNSTSSITPHQLRLSCRRLHMEYGLDLIIVDNSHRIASDENTSFRIKDTILTTLKTIAQEVNVPVLASIQLPRTNRL